MKSGKQSVSTQLSSGDLGYLVTEVRNRILLEIDQELAPIQLTAVQFLVFDNLVNGKGRTLSEFCRLLGYDSAKSAHQTDASWNSDIP
ncbi:hypothetical protein [Cupriavidus pauculus]|uniref:hypothetical protein n=1 Tax=Cupriavidus pauculus TaxID=82633 RepID=UPI0007819B0B|nr:hypothetical protein [Cupriavidus pauculus]